MSATPTHAEPTTPSSCAVVNPGRSLAVATIGAAMMQAAIMVASTAMFAGVLTVGASAIVLVSAAHLSAPWFAVALFALGYGWSMSILGGSALLVRDAPPTEQLRVQGGVEAWVWGAAAFATFTSTQLLALGGYRLLATVCVILVAVTLLFILRAGAGRPPPVRSSDHAAQEVTMTESAQPPRRRPVSSALWLPLLKYTSGREPS